jgi:23S rRNA pseudouridine2605 synthase
VVHEQQGTMRLQRVLARAGIASRRKAELLITAGRVTVNGKVATLGESADPERDDIRVDGKPVRAPGETVWLALNKPAQVMTSRGDPRGRKTVYDFVEDVPGLTYVGRLDYLTEGLLLLTNDGEAVNVLMHPSNAVERTYVAVVRGDAPAAARVARGGMDLDDGPVRPTRVAVRPIGDGRYEFEVTITEGRKREVRRLCKALGLRVERLIRLRYGPVALGKLEPGKTRPLTSAERREIARIVELSRTPDGPIFEGP